MTRYEKRNVVVCMRLAESEKTSLDNRAKALGVTTSSLIRALANIPIEPKQTAEGLVMPEYIVFDAQSLTRLTHAINTYGSLYNQAVKSLNSIAKHGARNDAAMMSQLEHVSMQLDQVYAGVMLLEEDAGDIAEKSMVYLESADGRSLRW